MFFKLCYFVSPFADSALAIQSGNYTIPEPFKYSPDIVGLLSEYSMSTCLTAFIINKFYCLDIYFRIAQNAFDSNNNSNNDNDTIML